MSWLCSCGLYINFYLCLPLVIALELILFLYEGSMRAGMGNTPCHVYPSLPKYKRIRKPIYSLKSRPYNFQPNEPSLNLNINPFQNNLKYSPGVIYNPCPQALGVCSNPKTFLYDIWTVWNKMAISKCLLVAFRKNRCVQIGGGGRIAALDLFDS